MQGLLIDEYEANPGCTTQYLELFLAKQKQRGTGQRILKYFSGTFIALVLMTEAQRD